MKRREAIQKISMGTTGLVLSVPMISSLLSSCGSETTKGVSVKVFSADQKKMLETLCEIFIPKDKTSPGAKEAECVKKIDLLMKEILDEAYVKFFNNCFQTFSEVHGENFKTAPEKTIKELFEISDEEKDKIIKKKQKIEDHVSYFGSKKKLKLDTELSDKMKTYLFLLNLKNLALTTYFHNEKVGETILSYDPVPGEYLGCIPVEQVGNRWSLSW